MKRLFLAAIAPLALIGCETSIPVDDAVSPTVSISINDGGTKLIATTGDAAIRTGCASGTSLNQAGANGWVNSTYGINISVDESATYFFGSSTPPYEFVVTGSDSGGMASVKASMPDDTVSSLRPDGSISVTNVSPSSAVTRIDTETRSSGRTFNYRVVESIGSRSDPRTALIMSFEADRFASTAFISATGRDFSGNTDLALVWLVPDRFCE